MSKNLYIISGCNGAGKTTASYSVLPKMLDCLEFVNADEIARGLSPFNPESVAIEAGRLMLHRIEDLLAKDETFAIETTLATKSYINLVRRAQAKGYQVNVLFFWLRTPELALQRIAERVASGGHNIFGYIMTSACNVSQSVSQAEVIIYPKILLGEDT